MNFLIFLGLGKTESIDKSRRIKIEWVFKMEIFASMEHVPAQLTRYDTQSIQTSACTWQLDKYFIPILELLFIKSIEAVTVLSTSCGNVVFSKYYWKRFSSQHAAMHKYTDFNRRMCHIIMTMRRLEMSRHHSNGGIYI